MIQFKLGQASSNMAVADASTMDHSSLCYLVSYGTHGHLGLFVPADGTTEYHRGSRVTVRSDRGIETGSVLCPSANQVLPQAIQHQPGEILGLEETQHEAQRDAMDELAITRYREARHLLKSLFLPLQVVDIEILSDPATVVMHVLQFSPCDFSGLQQQLCQRWQTQVLIHDITNPEALSETTTESGCGSCSSGGCGSGGCGSGGCSTGSCSSHVAHETFQRDWQAYFAELRGHMTPQ